MKRILPYLATFSLLVFSLNAKAVDDIENGAQKYQTNCLVCHGTKGLGDGPGAATLSHKPANLAKKVNSLFSFKFMMSNAVLNGKVDQGMPAWKGILTKQDTYDIFAYIKSIQ